MLNLTYEYKLAPTLEQAAVIEDWLEICRKVYNHALTERKDWARSRKCPINACSIDREYIIPAESPQNPRRGEATDFLQPVPIIQCQSLAAAKLEFPELKRPHIHYPCIAAGS